MIKKEKAPTLLSRLSIRISELTHKPGFVSSKEVTIIRLGLKLL